MGQDKNEDENEQITERSIKECYPERGTKESNPYTERISKKILTRYQYRQRGTRVW